MLGQIFALRDRRRGEGALFCSANFLVRVPNESATPIADRRFLAALSNRVVETMPGRKVRSTISGKAACCTPSATEPERGAKVPAAPLGRARRASVGAPQEQASAGEPHALAGPRGRARRPSVEALSEQALAEAAHAPARPAQRASLAAQRWRPAAQCAEWVPAALAEPALSQAASV